MSVPFRFTRGTDQSVCTEISDRGGANLAIDLSLPLSKTYKKMSFETGQAATGFKVRILVLQTYKCITEMQDTQTHF
jgi:hypothetical protein